eukprot:282365-Amphidinium_carterae.1
MRLVQQDGGSPELGPLERFGKISPGDVLKSVNDMDVSDFPHIAITGSFAVLVALKTQEK